MKHHIAPKTLRAGLIALALAAMVIPVACLSQQRELVRVNDEQITLQDLQRELVIREGARTLLQMIDMRLILNAAEQADISITDNELDLKLRQAIARIGSERDLEQTLRDWGRRKEDFRQELRAEALLERLALADHPLDDTDLRQYYDNHRREFSHGEQVRLRLILLRDKANADTVAQALQEPGADFAGLAGAFSEDPGTKESGGDTGFVERGDFARPITDRAFAMQPGEVSKVFEVPDGWAIIRVEEKRPAGAQPFEQVRETLRARVQVQHLEQATKDWLNKARTQAQLEIPDPALAKRVQGLIEAQTPFEPSNLAPNIPMAPR